MKLNQLKMMKFNLADFGDAARHFRLEIVASAQEDHRQQQVEILII